MRGRGTHPRWVLQEQGVGVGALLLIHSLRPSQEAADAALTALVRGALQA